MTRSNCFRKYGKVIIGGTIWVLFLIFAMYPESAMA